MRQQTREANFRDELERINHSGLPGPHDDRIDAPFGVPGLGSLTAHQEIFVFQLCLVHNHLLHLRGPKFPPHWAHKVESNSPHVVVVRQGPEGVQELVVSSAVFQPMIKGGCPNTKDLLHSWDGQVLEELPEQSKTNPKVIKR